MQRRLATFSAGLAMAAMMVALAIALAPPAHAALGLRETPDRTWTTNGIVYDQALSEDGRTLYIGGKFTQVRPPAGTAGQALAVNRVAAIDVATGAPVSAFRPAVTTNDGTAPVVRALAAKNGRVYIGGSFTTVGGQARRNLAAVEPGHGRRGRRLLGHGGDQHLHRRTRWRRTPPGSTWAACSGRSTGRAAATWRRWARPRAPWTPPGGRVRTTSCASWSSAPTTTGRSSPSAASRTSRAPMAPTWRARAWRASSPPRATSTPGPSQRARSRPTPTATTT